MEKMVMTVTDVSKVLSTSVHTIHEQLKAGEIPAYREGRNWKIPVSLLEQYICDRALKETEKRRSNAV